MSPAWRQVAEHDLDRAVVRIVVDAKERIVSCLRLRAKLLVVHLERRSTRHVAVRELAEQSGPSTRLSYALRMSDELRARRGVGARVRYDEDRAGGTAI